MIATAGVGLITLLILLYLTRPRKRAPIEDRYTPYGPDAPCKGWRKEGVIVPTAHDCWLKAGHADAHECSCGERWNA